MPAADPVRGEVVIEGGPVFLAAVLAETFEDFIDLANGQQRGELLHEALTRHGYRLTPIAVDSSNADYEHGWQDAITAMNPPGTGERTAARARHLPGMRRREVR